MQPSDVLNGVAATFKVARGCKGAQLHPEQGRRAMRGIHVVTTQKVLRVGSKKRLSDALKAEAVFQGSDKEVLLTAEG